MMIKRVSILSPSQHQELLINRHEMLEKQRCVPAID
jgi:hypothetical protein